MMEMAREGGGGCEVGQYNNEDQNLDNNIDVIISIMQTT